MTKNVSIVQREPREMQVSIVLLIFIISACEAVGQSIAFIARQAHSMPLFLTSWLVYIGVVYFLYLAYGIQGVGFVNALWSGMTTILMIVIGKLFFKEKLVLRQFFFIGLILVGMIGLAW